MTADPRTLSALNAAVLSDTLDGLGLMQQARSIHLAPTSSD